MYRMEVKYQNGTVINKDFSDLALAKDRAQAWSELPKVVSVVLKQIEKTVILEIDGMGS